MYSQQVDFYEIMEAMGDKKICLECLFTLIANTPVEFERTQVESKKYRLESLLLHQIGLNNMTDGDLRTFQAFFILFVQPEAKTCLNMPLSSQLIILKMEHPNNFCNTKIRYSKITLKKRKQLVREVLEDGLLVSKTAKKLHISLSTAKLIIKRYKDQGTFFESKADKARRLGLGKKTSEKRKNKQRTPSVEEKEVVQEPKSVCNRLSNVLSTPQFFAYQDFWMETFPKVPLTFQGMMFYHF